MSTNHAQAGTSTAVKAPSLEFAEKVEIYNMARDQLANERNWLTWFRLSCTLILLGFSILIQFRLPDSTDEEPTVTKIEPANETIGLIFCIIGFACFLLGVTKYFKSQRLLVRQATYVQAGWGSYIIVAVLFCFVCTVMILALQ